MEKLLLIFALLALGAFARAPAKGVDFKALWGPWKAMNAKKYVPDEETNRYETFTKNYDRVLKHNNEKHSYKLALNQFADLTAEEFKSKYLTSIPQATKVLKSDLIDIPTVNETVIPTVNETVLDWRALGVVSPIRDQGQCGSCWAFSAAEAIESAVAIKTNKLTLLSPQQLIDCSRTYGNQGCYGGWMDYAFQYVKKKGIATEENYPYKAINQKCKIFTPAAKITSFVSLPFGNVAQLTAAVNQQPISVAVEAQNWQFYSSGIFENCGDSLDHAVLLVGYTSDAWLVQNQWSSLWGENGSIRLKLGNTCGIANVASYPVV